MHEIKYNPNRRSFLKKSFIAGTGTMISGAALMTACNDKSGEEVSPAEDLMREHGVLNRILLIYDNCSSRLTIGKQFSFTALTDSASIIRNFIEDYHEKLEEDFLFPRFEKANQLTDLVAILRQQHKVGRDLTDNILYLAKSNTLTNDNNKKLISLLTDFNIMYRPHEAREDTILFPALKKIISSHEYDSLGEDFENKEHELFGKDGF